MSFAADLWDQVKYLEDLSDIGISAMENMNEFLKGIAEAEAEYAKALKKTVANARAEHKKEMDKITKALGKVPNSTLTAAWEALINGTDEISNGHVCISEHMAIIRKSIKTSKKELEILNAENYKLIHQGFSELQEKTAIMEKLQNQCENDMREVDAITAVYKKSAKDVGLAKSKLDNIIGDYEKKVQLGKDSTAAYTKAISDVNNFKNNYYETDLPKLLDKIQKDDEDKRINYVKQKFSNLGSTVTETISNRLQTWNVINTAFNEIEKNIDYNNICLQLRTGDLPPSNFNFADTNEITKKKMLLKNNSTDVMKMDQDPEDAIIDLGKDNPKKARKAAVERAKQIDKDIMDVQRQRQGFETILAAGKGAEELLFHKEALNMRLETLLARKHKLHCYTAKLDGKPLPELPTISKVDLNSLPDIGSKRLSTTPGSLLPASPSSAKSKNASHHLSSVTKDSPVSVKDSPAMKHQDSPKQDSKKCIVLYDFEAAPDSMELSIKVDDIVTILSVQDDGWTKVKDSRSQEGFIPSAYIQPL